MKQRGFSLYDIEQFLRDAGAERINERALMSFEKELEETVNELLGEATVYANYAGRKRLIKHADISLIAADRHSANSRVLQPNRRRSRYRKKSIALSQQHATAIQRMR